MQGKYVMTKTGPVLFPDTFIHATFRQMNPSSAGMFRVEGGKIEVYGRSESLGLDPRFEDVANIARLFEMDVDAEDTRRKDRNVAIAALAAERRIIQAEARAAWLAAWGAEYESQLWQGKCATTVSVMTLR